MPRTKAVGLVLTVGLLAAVGHPLHAMDPGRIAKGDTVKVAADGAEFYVEGILKSHLGKDTAIQVVEVAENPPGDNVWWVGGKVDVDGTEHNGWVNARTVYRQDDPAAVAALKKFDIRIENNYLGNVLRVDAKDADLPGEALAHLKGLYSLEGLELSGTNVSNDDLAHLNGLTNLRWLYLDNTRISDDVLKHLSSLVRLDVLALNKTQVRGPGLAHVVPLKQLRVLNLSECKISDDALEHIQGMGHIQTLALAETPINGSGLRFLKDMPWLNVLNLNKCQLDDGTLLNLKGAQELRILHLEGAQADQDSKDELEEAIDSLAIFD